MPTDSVEEGDGPAVESTEMPPERLPSDYPADPTEEPTEEATSEEPAPEVANFQQKYTYPDGLEIEVTKIKHGKTNAYETEIDSEAKIGDPWVMMSIRVKNGSNEKVDTYGSATVTYGPDGDSADTAYLEKTELNDVSGILLPGKAKTGTYAYRIPAKYQDEVVMEFNADFNHEAAVFSGSVK